MNNGDHLQILFSHQFYIENKPVQVSDEGKNKTTRVFQDFQNLQRIWTHPLALRYNSDRFEESEQKRRDALSDEDEVGSLEDFIDDDDDDESISGKSTGSDDAETSIQPTVRRTRAMRANSE